MGSHSAPRPGYRQNIMNIILFLVLCINSIFVAGQLDPLPDCCPWKILDGPPEYSGSYAWEGYRDPAKSFDLGCIDVCLYRKVGGGQGKFCMQESDLTQVYCDNYGWGGSGSGSGS